MISKKEYAPYFEQYLKLVSKKNTSIVDNLEVSQIAFERLLRNLLKEKHCFSYAEGKWTLKELLQHIIDTERIFCYRALCFVRDDNMSVSGFDQDLFVTNSNANHSNFKDLLNEMAILRKGTIFLFNSFSKEYLLKIGVVSDNKISVRALGYLISGHQLHHLNTIKEKYLP
jgi:hypothetical protein